MSTRKTADRHHNFSKLFEIKGHKVFRADRCLWHGTPGTCPVRIQGWGWCRWFARRQAGMMSQKILALGHPVISTDESAYDGWPSTFWVGLPASNGMHCLLARVPIRPSRIPETAILAINSVREHGTHWQGACSSRSIEH